MNGLAYLQQSMQDYLLNKSDEIEQFIEEKPAISRLKRLSIYQEGYYLRLVEALANNFPILQRLLGDCAFHQLGIDYSADNPSQFRSIRWFGHALSTYLTAHQQFELAELAEFEWTLALAFDAPDAPVLKIDHMAGVPAEQWIGMTLCFHPSMNRLNFLTNAVAIWQHFIKNDSSLLWEKNATSTPWVLWRHQHTPRFYALVDDEAWALDQALGGASFGALCEGLCAWNAAPNVGMRAASFLKNWIESGLIVGLNLSQGCNE